MYVTQLDKDFEGDTIFPKINEEEWIESENNTYILIDINGNEVGPKFKDLMVDHGLGCHWFKNENDLFGIIQI